MDGSTPGLPVHHQLPDLLKLMSIESVMPSNHLILCRPLLLPPSIFPSIRVFSFFFFFNFFYFFFLNFLFFLNFKIFNSYNASVFRIRWPEYWSFSFSISPSNIHSGLISFRMDLLNLLAAQGTLKELWTPQFKSINSSVLSFLYNPTLTSIHDYWKDQSFD